MTPRAYAAAQRLSVDPGATPAEQEIARRRCAEHEAKHGATPSQQPRHWVEDMVDRMVAEHGEIVRNRAQARAVATNHRPWWTLKVSPREGVRHGRWMGNTTEFRTVLRGERDGRLAISNHRWSTYTGDDATLEALNSGAVDWTGLGDREPWKPSPELRRAIRESKRADGGGR